MRCEVIRVPASAPHDMKGVRALVEAGRLKPDEVIAVLGKTEGNGCVNDFTRGYAVSAFRAYMEEAVGKSAAHISYVMSGGTEGVLTPHFTIMSRSLEATETSSPDEKSLAIGVAHTRDFEPEEIGRMTQLQLVSEAVLEAMREAGIERAADVHFVQVKCPLLTTDVIHEAERQGKDVVTEDTYKSMGYSRGASALGVALALGEVDGASLTDEDICQSWDKFSSVASTSAGSELACCEVIVFGNASGANGPFFIEHEVMQDAIDGDALRRIIDKHPDAELVQVLAKAEADPSGFVRERRHTMLNDSDINHTRHARAVVGGVLAYVCGDPMIYVSGGAEHQGPAGGGPVAAIFKRANNDQ
ncbi:ring-opening amidohydrolase [Xylanibacillus composti]|uniref:Cyanuric acid amidohydrolase n=1 Tax=Xylanibacillus composti TaxID=1572762 RepID=A0A8J4M3A8_9BACL|nr:ring-opening amidohydrolase [Xylanibacillus composti]MDT9726141.1 ring-opening amidohydrolase [Xylanibacillus composti]GIQ70624.1 cyanuric acid amidohydrolase [Xylanibacillus composti]